MSSIYLRDFKISFSLQQIGQFAPDFLGEVSKGRLCLKISRSFIMFSNLVMGVFAIRILPSLPVIALMTSSLLTERVHLENSYGKKKVSFL